MFVNTNEFRRAALTFLHNEKIKGKGKGFYISAPKGTYDYQAYWDEELNRCINGYQIGDVKITGEHYGYLNYAQIKLTEDSYEQRISKKKSTAKIITFPDFWDGDYEYFWLREIAKNGITPEALEILNLESRVKNIDGGHHLIVAKARRKGFSYKNGWICANRYNTERNSVTLIGAFEKKYLYPNGTMSMASDYLEFLNGHTAWTKRRQEINKVDHKKASVVTNASGVPLVKGYKSQIMAISYKDNPDAGRGKDASLILMEEAGKFNNLKDSYLATQPTVEDGSNVSGQIIIFGTGGDMEGGTIDFSEMFYNPEPYNLLAFENIWDEKAGGSSCGFYVPDYVNKVGFIDKDGNSNREEAKDYELDKRDKIKRETKGQNVLTQHVTEYSFTPSEAFLKKTGNRFPSAELQHHLNYLLSNRNETTLGQNGKLMFDNTGILKWRPDSTLNPVQWPVKGNEEGCVIIWEHPKDPMTSPYGLYIAGTDPYDFDQSTSGSLGSTIIWKQIRSLNETYDWPVACWHGRPSKAEEYYEGVRRLLLYYNSIDLYENEKIGLKTYFEQKKSDYLLKDQPGVLDKIIKNSKVERGKGTHMNDMIKDQCILWANDWLTEEFAPGQMNLTKIKDQFLLQQLIRYNDTDNFDAVISFLLCILHKQDNHYIDVAKTEKKREPDAFFSKKLF